MSNKIATEWWADHANIVTLTAYMAEQGSTASDVAYAVEKPWKHTEEFAKAVLEVYPADSPTAVWAKRWLTQEEQDR